MKFPNLETMIMYGIYTIRDLIFIRKTNSLKRNVTILNECEYCSFVFSGPTCTNCNDIKNNSLV